MRVTAICVGLLMEIVRLNSDSNPAISIRAILLSKSDFNLVPWALVDRELALTTYCGYRIYAPYLIHELPELTHREKAIPPEVTLDADNKQCYPNKPEWEQERVHVRRTRKDWQCHQEGEHAVERRYED